PDGVEELCSPEREDEPPPLTDRPRYPGAADRGVRYGLTDGIGLQVFAVVVLREPRPYQEWKAQRGPSPWGKHAAPPGVVWYDDGTFVETRNATGTNRSERGKGQAVPGLEPVVKLTDWLRGNSDVETAAAFGFAVQARDQ